MNTKATAIANNRLEAFRGFVVKNWFFGAMLLVLIFGLQFPILGGTIKPFTKPLIFGAMFVMGIRQDFSSFLASIKDFNSIFFCVASSFILMPLLGYGIGKLFFSADFLMFTGVMISSAVSTTMVSSIVWTGITKGNESLAMVLSIITSIACVFAAPLILYVSLKASIAIPVGKMIKDLFVIIILPVIISQIIRYFLRVDYGKLSKMSKILGQVIILSVILMATSTPTDFGYTVIGLVLCAAVIQYLAISVFSYKVSRLFASKANAVAIMYCSSQKALSTAALISMTYFDPATSIYILVYHIFQQIMGQVTTKLLVKPAG
jgi:BASS family bile acid:Na+ symporter